jgi:hypothetical protein
MPDTDPAIMHVMTVVCGAIAIFILGEIFVAIRVCCLKKRKDLIDFRAAPSSLRLGGGKYFCERIKSAVRRINMRSFALGSTKHH